LRVLFGVLRITASSNRGSGWRYTLRACQHCDTPACAEAAPDAVTKRADGIVIIDPQKAHGRRDLVEACPFGAISWNEEAQVPQIWTMDAHLLDKGWTESRGSQACPTGALETRRLSFAAARVLVATGEVEPLNGALSPNPNVLYRNLARVRTAFIAGTIVARADTLLDAVVGAKVILSDTDGRQLAECTTDVFGDFRLPWDAASGSSCQVVVTDDQNRKSSVTHASGAPPYLGAIELS
jgi:Fe-S-cluster-containing dehydrogenase component